MEPKESRRKEIIKIKSKINELEYKYLLSKILVFKNYQ